MSCGGLDIRCSLQLLILALGVVFVALLLSELHVGVLYGLLHSDALGGVVLLGVLEQLSEVLLLVVVHCVSELFLLLEHLSLFNLLVDPVLLL